MGQSSASNYEVPIQIRTTDSHNAPSEIYKTGSLNAGGNNLTVFGTIITVDTGSNISIARPDVLSANDLKFIKPVKELSQENGLLFKENAKFG